MSDESCWRTARSIGLKKSAICFLLAWPYSFIYPSYTGGHEKEVIEHKEVRYNLMEQMKEYTKADENYHLVAGTVFSLVRQAKLVFESSEPNEKRQLINFLV